MNMHSCHALVIKFQSEILTKSSRKFAKQLKVFNIQYDKDKCFLFIFSCNILYYEIEKKYMGTSFQKGQTLQNFISACEIWHV